MTVAPILHLREELLTAFHVLHTEGQNSGIAGHVSARVPGERILGHAYGLAFDEVRGEARLVDLSLPGREVAIPADSVVAPLPGIARDGLVAALNSRRDTPTPISVGDCQSPRTALEVIYEGHRAGRRV